MTEDEIIDLINLNLADASSIPAEKHREVETAIVNLIKKLPKTKVLTISSFNTDRNYSVATDFVSGTVITAVQVFLECKNPVSGFVVGDIVTAPTPYPADNGRTTAQGIGVQFNNSNPATIKVMVNDQLTIMTAYKSASGATADNYIFSGGLTANWKIKLLVNYILS